MLKMVSWVAKVEPTTNHYQDKVKRKFPLVYCKNLESYYYYLDLDLKIINLKNGSFEVTVREENSSGLLRVSLFLLQMWAIHGLYWLQLLMMATW